MRYYFKLLKLIDIQGRFLSLKNDIEMVKEELNSEEKFFEKAVITEKFVKKYKNIIVGSLVVIFVAVSANISYSIYKQNKISSANEALSKLQKNPQNAQALSELKASSGTLYDVWSYSQAISNKDTKALKELTKSKTMLISDLASYELANNATSLNEYALKQNAIYKDLAIVQSAVFLMRESKVDEAREKLQSISVNSSLYKIADALLHYGIK